MKIIKDSNIQSSLAILGITLVVAVLGIYISRSEATQGYLAASGNSSILQVGGGGVLGIDNPTNGMVVPTGNVGIGTANPSQKLEVVGDVSVIGLVSVGGTINKRPDKLPLLKVLPTGGVSGRTMYFSTAALTSGAIAFDGTSMWVPAMTTDSKIAVTKVSSRGEMEVYYLSFPSGGATEGIAFDGTNMWVTNSTGSVGKVTPAGVITIYSGTGADPAGIAFDGTNMWTANNDGNSVTKITPAGAMTTYTGTGAGPWGIAFDGINMWTANKDGNSVTKITPAGAMTTYTGTGAGPAGIAFDGTNMWTANSGATTVNKITPDGTITLYNASAGGSYPTGIAFDGTYMWTANFGTNSVSKIRL